MQRFSTRFTRPAMAASSVQVRHMTYPLSRPPIPITYLDSDPLEYALRTEGRVFGFDDFTYNRELAFVRINDNPTVGEFRAMTTDERRKLFWGSDRQDFYRWFTFKVCGQPEHLYHDGW